MHLSIPDHLEDLPEAAYTNPFEDLLRWLVTLNQPWALRHRCGLVLETYAVRKRLTEADVAVNNSKYEIFRGIKWGWRPVTEANL
jgi:hypothetical protein